MFHDGDYCEAYCAAGICETKPFLIVFVKGECCYYFIDSWNKNKCYNSPVVSWFATNIVSKPHQTV